MRAANTPYTITVSEASKKRSLTHHIETWLWDWSYNKRTGKTLEWLLESLKRSCCVRTYPDDWESKVPRIVKSFIRQGRVAHWGNWYCVTDAGVDRIYKDIDEAMERAYKKYGRG